MRASWLWWLPALVVMLVCLVAVEGCGPSATRIGTCARDGGVQRVQVQSVNAAFVDCHDGRVFRYDTNNG